jgi:hypothetical protein
VIWYVRAIRADGTVRLHTTTPRRRRQSEKWRRHVFFFTIAIAFARKARRRGTLRSRRDRSSTLGRVGRDRFEPRLIFPGRPSSPLNARGSQSTFSVIWGKVQSLEIHNRYGGAARASGLSNGGAGEAELCCRWGVPVPL